ncbi:pentapeptide repeat-containing protein [Streptomyces sp. NPDC047043]|uniref:pentapeptide repeat-containing protein n=1 Tax=Streptomyces sp. NPDC047043 TaxID=3154497 RepID=UPI0033DB58D5
MKRIARRALPVGLVVLTVGFVLLLWRGPWWVDGAHLRSRNLEPADGVVITGFRTMVVAMGAAIVAGLGVWYTHQTLSHTRAKDREQAELTREGQVTERYVEAIKLLASQNMTQRIGGVYSLERIMHDSVKDHMTVVEVLAAFVRQQASAPTKGDPSYSLEGEDPYLTKEDVRAAMIVIGRRPDRWETGRLNLAGVMLQAAELNGLNFAKVCFDFAVLAAADLESTDLSSAELFKVNLSAARLHNATLPFAKLQKAKLERVNLTAADLSYGDFSDANLSGADLQSATLDGANFSGAVLNKSQMSDVSLEDTNLRGADLRHVTDLSITELCRAQLDTRTQLPGWLAADARVQARMAECS